MEGKSKVRWEDIEKYHEDLHLSGTLEELYEKLANEVFYLMFNNRGTLLSFNAIVARYVSEIHYSDLDEDEIKRLFKRSGFLKRARIPEWCKKAVFFRDRGRCAMCGKDLSGLFSVKLKKHYDHIVPLALGGLNDVSNIQLLCSGCNNKKNKHEISSSNLYEFWY